jgi:2-polyprenyl-6-methoxyphenol hydroxylase-like FAD-dependent oxidoreductase
MQKNYDVVIVGGGMVGSLLACALGDSHLKVAVLERVPPAAPPVEDYDLRVSAITLASSTVFQAVGAWPGIERRRISELREMRVWDTSGAGTIHFDSADIGEPRLGYIIENSVILAALRERLQQFANVEYLCPADIAEIVVECARMSTGEPGATRSRVVPGEVSVALKDGQHIKARVLSRSAPKGYCRHRRHRARA